MTEALKSVLGRSEKLFGKRGTLMSLWQELADNFYPERADFTTTRTLGEEFADNLDTSYPLLARRELGDTFGAMLRPTAKEWFNVSVAREDRLDTEGRQWLEWATGLQRRAMYDRPAKFLRATKEGDHDYATFGQCVLSVDIDRENQTLLYRSWHLRDVAWCENAQGEIDTVCRKWKPFATDLKRLFPNVHDKVIKKISKDPYGQIDVRHIVIPADLYETGEKWRFKYVSLYIDVENKHVMEAISVPTIGYVIPRWQTVSGSQYAYSPATVAALPDARLIQAMTAVLLTAGEKAVDPPMIAVQEAIKSDVSIYAGGITWTDQAYDEKLGEVLRPLTQDRSGIPLGMDLRRDTVEMIQSAFYLNKLSLPMMAGDMTAFEVGQRVQEYVRQAMPLFEPVEHDYNGALCEMTFDLLWRNGAFGAAEDLPMSLRGADIQFKFESPLHDAIERQKGQKFLESKQLLSEAAEIDPSVVAHVDVHTAFREVLTSVGMPSKWMNTEDKANEILEQQAEANKQQTTMQTMQDGAGVAEQVGKAEQAMAE